MKGWFTFAACMVVASGALPGVGQAQLAGGGYDSSELLQIFIEGPHSTEPGCASRTEQSLFEFNYDDPNFYLGAGGFRGVIDGVAEFRCTFMEADLSGSTDYLLARGFCEEPDAAWPALFLIHGFVETLPTGESVVGTRVAFDDAPGGQGRLDFFLCPAS